ncbi:glycosyltransferase [Nitrospira sp. T9]|uniref:glycosyltransferase n=1 Tax=unclassified Nitrospira TaxID=2652172 RepID=UPI003F9C09B2
MNHRFPESRFAHHWLDGLSGLEIGPSSHNPFGLRTRTVGLGGEGYTKEQLALTGEVAPIDIKADAGAIPLPSESEDFILASHVIEHCPDVIKTLLEWFRLVKHRGYLFLVVPHRDAAPSDRGKPLTDWDHVVQDYLTHATQESEPEGDSFLYCHYHVFSPGSMKEFIYRIFGNRLALVGEEDPDDKVGNGFSLIYQKMDSLSEAFPWSFQGGGCTVNVTRPADFYFLRGKEKDTTIKEQKIVHIEKFEFAEVCSLKERNLQRVDKNEVLVSAIVPAYNSERFMRGLLDDLEAQTLADRTEIIIVETGSETNESQIIHEFQKKFDNIFYLRSGNRTNATAAVNEGLRLAKGKYLTVAPTDDRLSSSAFEVMVEELEKYPEVGTVYADVFITQHENQKFDWFIRGGYSIRFDFCPEMMLTGYHMGPLFMWRSSIHEKIGVFNDAFLCASDYEFHCRVARHFPMRHIPQFLGLYFQNPKGTVNSNPAISQKEFRTIIAANRSYFPAPIQKPLPIFQYEQQVFQNKYVNIGMVTFNRLEFTKQAIAALFQHTCFPHVITVVDNGSTDGTPEYLLALHKQGFISNLILLPANVGIAKASNLAWGQEPEAEYYLKLDNDIVIQKPGWLSRMVEVIDRIPELGAIAYNFEPVNYPICEMRGLPLRPKIGNLNGACTLIPKRTHQILGFWCEDYGLYGEEDADYGLRMQLQGLQNAYMEDEQIGLHLPAGRAAHIDVQTLKATDGIEEKTFAEYRAFKDESRRKNVQDIAKKNWEDYQAGVKSLYCSSSFVKEFHKDPKHMEGSVGTPRRGFQANEKPREVILEKARDSSGERGRTVSVIGSDYICGRIRLLQPLLAGAGIWKNGTIVNDLNILSGEATLPPMGVEQVWAIQRNCRLPEKMLEEAQSHGTRIVYDCDDLLWKIPLDNPNHGYFTPEYLQRMFGLMYTADCVTVSTEPIQTDLFKRGIDSTLLLNCLVRQEWEDFKPRRRAGSRPRIGWAGQAKVHKGDAAILETIIEALKDEVEWVFLGDAPQMSSSPGVISETFSMVDVAQYPKKLASLNLDLALAPLVPNPFNEAKSDIRILQYGILGYPVIGTDIFPHQHAPIIRLPHEPQAWIKAIRERIHDLGALEREGDHLRAWVLNHRLMEHVLPLYEQAWLGRDVKSSNGVPQSKIQSPPVPPYSPINHAKYSFECSIIIPVWNKVALTRQCLTHLAEVTDGCSYEVIVVDNASTDETPAFLSSLSGDIQVITNPANYGFAKACNQGAASAKGRFLVFLNNDTIPKPGWLRALLNEVESHQDVAIVGSKLLYPNNTIQHAGVVFAKHCLTPYHIFRGAPGDLRAANVRQEFQVVTAACMLIRREEFNAVGQFDEIYQNGFEDVDLCLKVGKRGKKVIYQPESVLYHLEHQTPGRKDHEAERHNGIVLMERWASSIVVDEDFHTVPAGYATRYSLGDGRLQPSLQTLQGDREITQWQRVQRVQEFLLRQRHAAGEGMNSQDDGELQALLSEYRDWPDDGEVLRWAAKLCQSLQLLDGERAFLKRILSMGEDRAARERLAKLALSGKDLSEATEQIQALLQSDPNNGSGHWLQGILLMQSQQCAEAALSFRRALQCGADSRKTRIGLGMAYMGTGDSEEAWKIFEQVMVDHPDDVEAMNGLIQAGTSLERWKDLGGRLARYVERNPADCDMRFALAGVEFRASRLDVAKQQFEMLSLLKPDYEGLHDLEVLLQTAPLDRHALAT